MLTAWFDVVRLLVDLKADRKSLQVPIVDAAGKRAGHLEPLTQRHLNDTDLVETFVRWRNQNVAGWLDQRPVTFEQTRNWLFEVVSNPTRVTFLLFSGSKLVGRCGNLSIKPREFESDGLVRGERGGGLYFMHWAQIAGLIWSFRALKSDAVISKVLASNEAAFDSCRQLGYDLQPFKERPVFRKHFPEGDVLEDWGAPDELVRGEKLLYLRLPRENFFQVVNSTPAFRELDAELARTL